MTPVDRAALAARLRALGDSMRAMSDHLSARYGDPPGTAHIDCLAAAAELQRPRPRVESVSCGGDHFAFRIVGQGRSLCQPLIRATAESYRADLLAAGFDVDPLPEVHDAR